MLGAVSAAAAGHDALFRGNVPACRDIWFDRSVGLYGWMDTMFPAWVDNVALVPAAGDRAALRPRAGRATRGAARAPAGAWRLCGDGIGVLLMLGATSTSAIRSAKTPSASRAICCRCSAVRRRAGPGGARRGARWAPVGGGRAGRRAPRVRSSANCRRSPATTASTCHNVYRASSSFLIR